MKLPKFKNIKIDTSGTHTLRRKMAGVKKIKITINVDSDTLASIREISVTTGIPYQTLINRMLRDDVSKKKDETLRLNYLEKELTKIKRKLAA